MWYVVTEASRWLPVAHQVNCREAQHLRLSISRMMLTEDRAIKDGSRSVRARARLRMCTRTRAFSRRTADGSVQCQNHRMLHTRRVTADTANNFTYDFRSIRTFTDYLSSAWIQTIILGSNINLDFTRFHRLITIFHFICLYCFSVQTLIIYNIFQHLFPITTIHDITYLFWFIYVWEFVTRNILNLN